MEDVAAPPTPNQLSARPWLRWVIVVLCGVGICAASSIPGDAVPRGLPAYFDKLVHATEFALLGFFLMRAVLLSRLRRGHAIADPPIVLICIVAAIVALFGGLDELRQTLTPGRDASGYDVIADAVGAILGSLLGWRLRGIS